MKDIYKPVMQAIVGLFLILMVKLVSMLILKDIGVFYSLIDIILAIGVVVILLRFMRELNGQLLAHPEKQTIVTGITVLLAILIIYWTFLPYAYFMPYFLYSYGFYHIVFFILALIPVYNIWKVIDQNTEKISDLLTFPEKKRTCSCGMENPDSNKFCGKCGTLLE